MAIEVPWEPRSSEAARLLAVIARHDFECLYCAEYRRWSRQPVRRGHYAPGCRRAMELSAAFIRAQTYGEAT